MDSQFLFFYENDRFLQYASMISVNLAAALVIELSVAFLIGVRGQRNFGVMFNVNCLTNPIAVTIVFLMIQAWGNGLLTQGVLFLMEIGVVFFEGAVYKKKLQMLRMNPFRLSFILNAVSYGAGLLLEVISALT